LRFLYQNKIVQKGTNCIKYIIGRRTKGKREFTKISDLGGDGNHNSTINALMEYKNTTKDPCKDITFIFLSGGSGNGLGYALGDRMISIRDSFYNLQSGKTTEIDIIKCNNSYGFSAGFGLDAEIEKTVKKFPNHRTLDYTYSTLSKVYNRAYGVKRYNLEVNIDGKDYLIKNAYRGTIATTSTTGHSFTTDPKASILENGHIWTNFFNNNILLDMLTLPFCLLKITYPGKPNLSKKGKEVIIKSLEKPIPWHLDGEAMVNAILIKN
jgi:diacylglycerol kinase family enzyme